MEILEVFRMLSLKFVFDCSERQPELNHGLKSPRIGMGVVAYFDGTQVYDE
jgi:hypothetical protein